MATRRDKPGESFAAAIHLVSGVVAATRLSTGPGTTVAFTLKLWFTGSIFTVMGYGQWVFRSGRGLCSGGRMSCHR